MAFFGRGDRGDRVDKARLEKKLCTARETPEPVFDLSSCSVDKVPHGVYSLCKVFRKLNLDLSDNRLTCLDGGGDLADLALLEVLSLSRNRLVNLPRGISLLVNLSELRLDHNRLVVLPDSVGQLRHLRVLTVSSNDLRSLPDSLADLKNLVRLDVRANPELKTLPDGLCGAVSLRRFDADPDAFVRPPSEVVREGAEAVLRFLSAESGIPFEPSRDSVESPPSDRSSGRRRRSLSPTGERLRDIRSRFADREAEESRFATEFLLASERQREKFLREYALERDRTDAEIDRLQQERDRDRDRLVERIREDERRVEAATEELLAASRLDPERVRRELERDEAERAELLEACRSEYVELKRNETLEAIEALLREECDRERSLKVYGDSLTQAKSTFLETELDSDRRLGELIRSGRESRDALVDALSKDEALQRAAVGTLLERCDARSRSLLREIAMVESQLAKLSEIELDRRRLELDGNLDRLAVQRCQLSALLIDLLERSETRKSQLVETLQLMEAEKSSPDFWLVRYQRLLETAPEEVVVAARSPPDPAFVDRLLREGVIHCLPFLSGKATADLSSLDDDRLRRLGITSAADRRAVSRAIGDHLREKTAAEKLRDAESPRPSAPTLVDPSETDEASPAQDRESECIVCMENSRTVVFIPCGHLCCCGKCSEDVGHSCPMCRQEIERKIRIIQP